MTTDAPKPLDLHHAAGEEAAGELDQAEQAAFTRIAADNPEVARDCAFWRCLHARLSPREPDPAWAPGRSFAAGIRQRLEHEDDERRRPRAVVIPLPRWIAAGLAAGFGVLIGYAAFAHAPSTSASDVASSDAIPLSEVIGYQDDGGTVVTPEAQHVRWASYMPRTHLSEIETTLAHATTPASTLMKPWPGVWTKPIVLETHGVKDGHGHLVLRIANGSPAYLAGIRPGDVLLTIDNCPVVTPHCIADHLVKAKPGDEVLVKYWSAETASLSEVSITLGCLCE